MIFKHTAQWVLDKSPHTGEPKTQTRRPAMPGDTIRRIDDEIVMVFRNGRCIYHVGCTYAIQPGRGKKSLGRFRLKAIRLIKESGDITEADARAEGFASPDDFRTVWRGMYGDEGLERPCYSLVINKE